MKVTSKTAQFEPTVSTSIMETQLVASFVSVHGNKSHEILSKSSEAAISVSYENAEESDVGSSETQKSRSETLDFD